MAGPATILVSKKKANSTVAITFPIDANLKATLLLADRCFNTTDGDYILADANGDGEIDTFEALQIGRVNLSLGNISDLTGLEYFTNLTDIALNINFLTNFNVLLPNLVFLSLRNNPLTSFNNAILPQLLSFNVHNTQMSTLDLSTNPLLKYVGAFNTPINTIDLSSNPNMLVLLCKDNPNLTSINIKNATTLDYANSIMLQDCWTNCPKLTTICADASEIPALTNYLMNCGVNTSIININSSCALAVASFNGSAITVFPNPITNVVNVNFGSPITEKVSCVLYDVLGKKVLEKNSAIGTNSLEIGMEQCAKGVYLLQMKIGDNVFNKSLIKQ